MQNLVIEGLIMGIITMVLGTTIFKIIIKKYNKTTILNKKEIPNGIYLSFFVTGIVLFMIIEFFNLNENYCYKLNCKQLNKIISNKCLVN